ncbi:MAG: LysE family transporter [Pseudomonadota bacterium]
MELFFIQWLSLVGIFILALASPGPDFVVIVRQSILYSKLCGILTALGFAIGVAVHVGYVVFGLATIIAQSTVIFTIIKVLGAAYLFYLGIQALRSKGFHPPSPMAGEDRKKSKEISLFKAFQIGFLTNLLNPKATLFFMAVFSQFITPDTVIIEKIILCMTCIVMTFLWFSFVAIILSLPILRRKFLNISVWIDKVCGVALIALSIKLLLKKVDNV